MRLTVLSVSDGQRNCQAPPALGDWSSTTKPRFGARPRRVEVVGRRQSRLAGTDDDDVGPEAHTGRGRAHDERRSLGGLGLRHRESQSAPELAAAAAACSAQAARYTAPTDRYQIQCSWNPGMRDSSTAGIATSARRTPEETSDGIVLPIAWNMLDATKINPDATKFHDMMRRYSSPTARTAGSFEKMPTSAAGAMWQSDREQRPSRRRP